MKLKKCIALGMCCTILAGICIGSLSMNAAGSEIGKEMKTITTGQLGKETVVKLEAEKYTTLSNGKVMDDNSASGGAYVGDFVKGSRAAYSFTVADAGMYQVNVRVAAPQGGAISVTTGTGETDTASFNSTASWQTYADVTMRLWFDAGAQSVTVLNAGQTWNFDCVSFTFLSETPIDSNISLHAAVAASSGEAAALRDASMKTVWTAEGKTGEYALMRFAKEYYVNEIKLYDAPGSHVTAAKLVFSDGTTQQVGALSEEGVSVKVEKKTVTWVKLIIESVSADTKQVSLAEMEVMGLSKTDSTCGIDVGLEGYCRTQGAWEMVSDRLCDVRIKDGHFEMIWGGAYNVREIRFVGLPAGMQSPLTGKLTFDDGSSMDLKMDISASRQATVSFESKKVTSFTVQFDGMGATEHTMQMVQAFGSAIAEEEPDQPYENIQIENRWKVQKIIQKDDRVMYADAADEAFNDAIATWSALRNEDGLYTIRNNKTLDYMVLTGDDDKISCLPDGDKTDAGLWKLVDNTSYFNIYNVKYGKRLLHVEKQEERPGEVLASDDADLSWYSAMWSFTEVSNATDHAYKITANKVEDTSGTAYAYTGNAIIANAYGTSDKWMLREDISKQPLFNASNSILTQAVYNLTMEEALLNIHDGRYGDVFWTGVNWGGVWTRDVSMSIQYALAWPFPEESKNSLLEKIVSGKDATTLMQDTGTGGSYPCSVDRIIMSIAIWEQYLASGDQQFLDQMYDIIATTIEQDYHVAYDKRSGLFKGETGGLDHRSKTYPDWMDEAFTDSIVNIAESKSSIVNILYTQTMNILSMSAEILGKGDEAVQLWKERSETLKKTVNEKFWLEDRGMYASFIYPDFMGSPVADKVDVIANGYAVMYGIASETQKQQVMENYPLVTYGAPTVWPQKNGRQAGEIYHNRGVWPGWEATLMIAAKENGNLQLADEIWRSCVRGAAMNLTNKEVIDYTTGEGRHSDRQLWSVAGTMAGYYRILFGMEYETDGIHFSPFVPEWLDGPFTLDQFTYRDSVLHLRVSGKGDTLTSIKVDGVEKPLDYVFSTTMTGEHTIEMVVADSGNRSKINLEQNGWAVCPNMPAMTINNDGVLSWKPDSRYTYLLWDGEKYNDVTGKSTFETTKDGYGIYSLVAVSDTGIYSEMSKPIVVNAPGNVQTFEAEDQQFKEDCLGSKVEGFTGTGYVNDKKLKSAEMKIIVEIPAGKSGEYLFHAVYNNQGDATGYNYCGIRSVYVDGFDAGTMVLPLSNHNFDKSSYVNLYLTEGKHTISVQYDDANWYDRNMNVSRNDVSYDSFELAFCGTDRVPDTETLQSVYNKALLYKQDGTVDRLVQSAQNTFNTAFDRAQAVLNGDLLFTGQRTIDEAAEELLDAMKVLNMIAADKTELNEWIALAEKVAAQLDKYKPAGQNEFLAALDKARTVAADAELLKGDPAVGRACQDLKDKMAALELKPSKEKLASLIEQAGELDLSRYTEASVKSLTDALALAKTVYEKAEATEKEIAQAETALQAAINALVLKEKPDDPSSGDPAEKPSENPTGNGGEKDPSDNVHTFDPFTAGISMTAFGVAALGICCTVRRKKK